MISRGVRGCEPSPASCRTRRRQGLCTPWPPRSRASRAGRAQRRKTVFAKSFLLYLTPVLAQHSDVLAQDAPHFHAPVRRHLDLDAQHPVDLPALLRCQGIEGAWSHLGIRREDAVPIPLKSLQHLLTAPYSLKLPLGRLTGVFEFRKNLVKLLVG